MKNIIKQYFKKNKYKEINRVFINASKIKGSVLLNIDNINELKYAYRMSQIYPDIQKMVFYKPNDISEEDVKNIIEEVKQEFITISNTGKIDWSKLHITTTCSY